MPQLTVYIDEETLKKVHIAARNEHYSISKWVKNKLTEALVNTWPKDFFNLFGSLAEEEIERPEQLLKGVYPQIENKVKKFTEFKRVKGLQIQDWVKAFV